ncbi:MAG: hypothetical protein ACRDLE_10710 [Gaiellaceae bacterium]
MLRDSPEHELSRKTFVSFELTAEAGRASMEQLAGGMGTTIRSGAFRSKVATARIFQAVAVGRGTITLTSLGKKLVDPELRAEGRIEAFLQVPLFKALFESHRSELLPPDGAVEQEMVRLGVSEKQAGRARQSFQRSAERAGFFAHGKNRLVEPKLPDRQVVTEERVVREIPAAPNDVLDDLWLTLLREGESWSPERTHEYVAAVRRIYAALSSE